MLADLYVLCATRDLALAQRLLDAWAPERTPAQDDAPPLDQLVHGREPYAVYFDSRRADDVTHAMLFFTADGAMIFGISVALRPETTHMSIATWLTRLALDAGAYFGHAAFEAPPAFEQRADFVAECREHALAIVDGHLIDRTGGGPVLGTVG